MRGIVVFSPRLAPGRPGAGWSPACWRRAATTAPTRWGLSAQHAVLFVRRTLAALPGPDRVLRQPRVGLHLPDLRAALRLPLPEAALQLVPKSAAEVVTKPPTWTRTARSCPTMRRPSRSPRACTTCAIRPGMRYQPHPAFADDAQGKYRLPLPATDREQLGDRRSPFDFEHQGTRELVAEDFVYATQATCHHAHRGACVAPSSPST
jgi:hypothetical protein